MKTVITAMIILLSCSIVNAATSVTQHGITWTFSADKTVGQFVNGDYYVIGQTTINSISPAYTSSPRAKNGSMINPVDPGGYYPQGYDGASEYNAALNVGINMPLTINPGDSLVSTESVTTPENTNASYVKNAAVLTCLSEAPASGTFRPGISGATKTLYNYNDLNISLLKRLAVPSGQTVTTSTLTAAAVKHQMVWLDHYRLYTARRMHPVNGFSDNYYFTLEWAANALYLHLDFTEEEKRDLLIGYMQLAIDLYSNITSGSVGWYPNGGHSSGRKWPILFAGLLFNDSGMKGVGAKSGDYINSSGHSAGNVPSDYIYFGEDAQTFYVTQAEIDRTSGSTWVSDSQRYGAGHYLSFDIATNTFTIGDPGANTVGPWAPDTRNDATDGGGGTVYCRPYTTQHLGMADWGVAHGNYPYTDDADANYGNGYRNIASGAPSWAGFTIAARLMGAKALWNHDSLFDYVDRYEALTEGKSDPFGYSQTRWRNVNPLSVSPIISAMFDTYRNYNPGTKYKNVKSITQDQQ
jgi:hypothetical protein